MFHPREKTPSIQTKSQTRDTKKIRGGKRFRKRWEAFFPENVGKPSSPGEPLLSGDRASRPRRDSFRRSPLAELDVGARSFADSTLCSPERHRTSRDRKTVPRPPHIAAQGVVGERTGPNAKLGERGASKGALPGMACSVPGKEKDPRGGRVSNIFRGVSRTHHIILLFRYTFQWKFPSTSMESSMQVNLVEDYLYGSRGK